MIYICAIRIIQHVGQQANVFHLQARQTSYTKITFNFIKWFIFYLNVIKNLLLEFMQNKFINLLLNLMEE